MTCPVLYDVLNRTVGMCVAELWWQATGFHSVEEMTVRITQIVLGLTMCLPEASRS